jgi:protein SCO1/2
MKKAILIFAALLLLAGGGAAIALALRFQRDAAARAHGTPVVPSADRPAEFLKDYVLTERSGAKFDSKSLKGKVHLVNFFFATCPARCPLQTQHIAQIQSQLKARNITADQAMLISITVDPANDTPAVLRDYADKYKADKDQWVFLTGDADYLARVAGEIYQVPYERQTHIERVLLVDKWGRIRGTYRWYDPTDFALLQRELFKLLDETEPPELEAPPREEVPGEKEALEEAELERAIQEGRAVEPSEEEEKNDGDVSQPDGSAPESGAEQFSYLYPPYGG